MKDQTLFDLLNLPEGIDKDTLCDNIILQGGEFEVLYADPDFMRAAIGTWSNKCYNTFLKWITAQQIEYNPLENYDRIEGWSDSLNKGVSTSARRDSGNTRTFDNTDTTTPGTTYTEETKVSAFDSSNYQPSQEVTTTPTGDGDVLAHAGTIKDEYGEGTSGQEKENSKTTHDGRIHGNIGTLTSQKMLADEYEVARFNIIDQITDMFILEFCIPIYD